MLRSFLLLLLSFSCTNLVGMDFPLPFNFQLPREFDKDSVSETENLDRIPETYDWSDNIGKKRHREEPKEEEEKEAFAPLKKKYKKFHLSVNTAPRNSPSEDDSDYYDSDDEDDENDTVYQKEKLRLFNLHQEYIKETKRFNAETEKLETIVGEGMGKLEVPETCYMYSILKFETSLLNKGYKSPKNMSLWTKMLTEYRTQVLPNAPDFKNALENY